MATATAKVRNLPVAPRKARLVADMIRGKKVADARDILQFVVKGSALPLRKLLDSAVANAENAAAERRARINTDDMVVRSIQVNEGRTLRGYIGAPRGRATRIRKRSCHIALVITDGRDEDE